LFSEDARGVFPFTWPRPPCYSGTGSAFDISIFLGGAVGGSIFVHPELLMKDVNPSSAALGTPLESRALPRNQGAPNAVASIRSTIGTRGVSIVA
jgi:hypothetical protein